MIYRDESNISIIKIIVNELKFQNVDVFISSCIVFILMLTVSWQVQNASCMTVSLQYYLFVHLECELLSNFKQYYDF